MEQKIDEILRMDPTLIDARLRTMLYKIPEERALLILNDFQKALIANRDTIRNPVAYLMGMAQRVLSARDLPENSKVQRELDRLFRQGRITPSDIDERCRDMLKHLPEDKAIDALHELGATDVSTLHNIAAFFMGIMKKHSKIPRTTQQSQSDSFRNKLDLYSSNNRQGVNPSHSTNINSNSHYSRSHSHPPQLLPPPRIMPSELMYGYGEQEYFPEMPKAINLSFLPISVQEQLHNLIDRGILVVDDLDERVLSELKSFSEDHLLAITKEFSSLDRNSVRNVPSYLLGISRKVPAPYAPSKNISIEERFPTKRPLDYYDDMERERGRNNYSHSSSHSSHTHPIHGHPSTSSHSSIIDRDRERDRDRDYRERDRYPSHTHSHQSQPPSSLQQQQHHHHHPPPPTSTSRYPSSGPSTNSYYPSSTSNSSSRDEQIRRGGNNMIGNNGINNNNNNNQDCYNFRLNYQQQTFGIFRLITVPYRIQIEEDSVPNVFYNKPRKNTIKLKVSIRNSQNKIIYLGDIKYNLTLCLENGEVADQNILEVKSIENEGVISFRISKVSENYCHKRFKVFVSVNFENVIPAFTQPILVKSQAPTNQKRKDSNHNHNHNSSTSLVELSCELLQLNQEINQLCKKAKIILDKNHK